MSDKKPGTIEYGNTMKPKIFIRTDGSPEIGLGHLVRCSALAHMLKNDFEITFMCREIPDTMITEFEAIGFGCSKINNEDEFFSHLNERTIVVLDGYHFDTEYQRKIKSKGSKLVCIDDLHDKEFLADLVINHSPGTNPQDYNTQAHTQFALGLDYALLRPAFLEHAKKQRSIEMIETILICFGGSDPKNLTQSTLEVAIRFTEFKKIIVVTGAAFQLSDDFTQIIINNRRIDHLHALSEKQMLTAMLVAELAIVPASGILFEVLASGCITISGCYVDNQKLLYENTRNAGLFVDAGNFGSEQLNHAICEVLQGGYNKTKPIDGQSGVRVSKLFDQLNKDFFISLRRAVSEDIDLTFRWAVNSEIRRYSFQQHQITILEHTEWFSKKIRDKNCHFFIVEYNLKPIGCIRFDVHNIEAIISYLLDPAYHGQGFGQLILKKGIERLLVVNRQELTAIKVISGNVMKNNIPSIKAFERLGFVQTDQGDYLRFEKSL
jgi:UDP-2,4-diacetamido-2,4,6-trideoxy-beta-L-altropyranose hydrolase